MKIRPICPEDYPNLRQLWESCPGVGLNEVDDSAEGIRKFLDRNPATCFAAQEGDRLTGAILAGHDGRRGYIYHLAVAEDCRRHGIATQLVEAALQALRSQGIRKAALVVFKDNQPGNAFWESQGFSRRDDLCYRNMVL